MPGPTVVVELLGWPTSEAYRGERFVTVDLWAVSIRQNTLIQWGIAGEG